MFVVRLMNFAIYCGDDGIYLPRTAAKASQDVSANAQTEACQSTKEGHQSYQYRTAGSVAAILSLRGKKQMPYITVFCLRNIRGESGDSNQYIAIIDNQGELTLADTFY